MKNAFAILLLIVLPCMAKSQGSLITINLSDTVQVLGEEFIYMITSYSNEYVEGMPSETTPLGVDSEMEIWLKSKSIPYEENEMMGYGSNSFYLRFKSLKEMEAVTKDLKSKIANTTGWLVQVNAPESEKHYEKLLDKLLQKAKVSAEQVAKKMGKQNIAIAEVNFTRGIGGETGGYVLYPPMSADAQDPMQYGGGSSKGKKSVGGSIVVKYLAN